MIHTFFSQRKTSWFFLPILVCLISLTFAPSALSAPVEPIPIDLTQPNGLQFVGQPFGDEWNNGYEYNGHTIIQSPISQYWVYAQQAKDGTLKSSEQRVGIDAPPLMTKRHLRDLTATPPENRSPRLPQAPNAWPGVTGSQPVLVILVDFTPSTSLGTNAAQWNTALFSDVVNAKSVKNLYDEASYNQFTINPAAETQGTANDGIIEVTLNYAHPNSGGSTGTANRTLTKDALVAADAFINYAAFDANNNNALDVTEFHLIVIPRGYETSFGGPSAACSPSVWGHRWSLFSSGEVPTLDGVMVGSFSDGGGYMQFGEWQDTTGGSGCPGNTEGNMATIGIMGHELGHDINWPDLYDTQGNDSAGIGYWGLMGSGSWGRASGEAAGTTPILPSAFSRAYQKWLTPITITSDMTNVDIPHASQSAAVYQLGANQNGIDWHFGNTSGTGEYFLVENRMQTGFDAGLFRTGSTTGGCVIWHIDETRTASNAANATQTRRLVDVVEASATQDLDSSGNAGDGDDTWPGTNNLTAFNSTSTPSTSLHGSGIVLETLANISAAGPTGCRIDFIAASLPEKAYVPIVFK